MVRLAKTAVTVACRNSGPLDRSCDSLDPPECALPLLQDDESSSICSRPDRTSAAAGEGCRCNQRVPLIRAESPAPETDSHRPAADIISVQHGAVEHQPPGVDAATRRLHAEPGAELDNVVEAERVVVLAEEQRVSAGACPPERLVSLSWKLSMNECVGARPVFHRGVATLGLRQSRYRRWPLRRGSSS